MKPRLLAAIMLSALWLSGLVVFMRHASPVAGSVSAQTSTSPASAVRATPPLTVVINEVAWAGTISNTNHEWIELKNNAALTVSLTGWQIRSADGSPSTTLSGEIPPWGYFLLARTNYTDVIDVPADMIYTGALVDSGEVLTLTDNLGNVMDTANANNGPWPAGTGGSGTPLRASMERINPLEPDLDTNWASNDGVIRNGHDIGGNPINGTPKSRNSASSANLGITQSAPGIVLTGLPITLTLVFSNAGKLNVAGAIITESFPITVAWITQSLPYTLTQAGQALVWQVGELLTSTGNVSLTFVVTTEASFAGALTATVVITSEVVDFHSSNNVFTTTTLVRQPMVDVSLLKTGPTYATAGRELTYTLTVTNTGERDAPHVIVTDTLPISATLVRATQAHSLAQPASGTLAWLLGDVPVGAQPISLTVVVTTTPNTFDWVTNQATVTADASEAITNNNTLTVSTLVTPPAAEVAVAKSAPAAAMAGREIVYTITLGNVGEVDAQNVIVTDTLPISVTFLRQSAPYTFTQQSQSLVWNIGQVSASAAPISWTVTGLMDMSATGVITNRIEASTVTYEPITNNNTAQATTVVAPSMPVVLINGVLYDGYQLNDADEAVQIVNVGLLPVNLKGYTLTEGTGGVQFPDYVLQVNQRTWAARDAHAFFSSFGFWPDLAVSATVTGTVQPLSGSWAQLGNTGGDVQIKSKTGDVLDRLVYGSGLLPPSGWSGPAVVPYTIGGVEGQILARVPDEKTGLPVPDTDTAADWIQYTGNYTTGRRVLYPGWDMTYPASGMARLFWPFTTTAPATVTLGVAPDNAYDVVRDAIRSAQHSIEIEAYELTSYGVITEVVQKARTGVSVTILLEGGPVGGLQDQERWACQEIEAVGGQCWFMYEDTGARIQARYRYIHAKFIVLDRKRLVISTQNFSGGGMPDDDKSDGTWGSRGYALLIESPELAARAGVIFDRDRDTAHADIARWGTAGFIGPGAGFTPITSSGGATTTVLFPAPRVFTDASHLELFTAPEAALRQSDALLGLLARAGAGDEVYVEQLYEYPDWGGPVAAPNARLQAYLDAARRGASVRLLLNSGQFGEEYIDLVKNISTTAYLKAIAQQEDLDLQVRMGDPTRYGIHSKLVLVKLNSAGLAYSHVGSINGSEASSKINREMAAQVESQALWAELLRIFQADWNLSAPVFLPLVMRDYTPPLPPADHIVISEVYYSASVSLQWVELYNPTGNVIDLSNWKIGDAETPQRFEGMYRFPLSTTIGPGGVLVIAYDGTQVPQANLQFCPNCGGSALVMPRYTGWGSGDWTLAGHGDQILLLGPNDAPVDVVVYGDTSYPGVIAHPGVIIYTHSLERFPASRDTDDCAADFRDRYPPTPGVVP